MPGWFAAVMGSGIVANAVVSLPRTVPGLHTGAVVVWAAAAVLLAGKEEARLLRLREAQARAREVWTRVLIVLGVQVVERRSSSACAGGTWLRMLSAVA